MAEAELKHMIKSFRVSDLQLLLGYAGRMKTGKKQELQARALELAKLRVSGIEMKIKELYNRRFHNQPLTRPANYDNLDRPLSDCSVPNYDSSMNNNYSVRSNPNTRPMSMNQGPSQHYPGTIKFKDLPFYDTLHVISKPSLIFKSSSVRPEQESMTSFKLLPQQVKDVAMSKDAVGNYVCQILLRFCILDSSIPEQDDNFPPNIILKVNNKVVPLPNPIPTNRPGVEPKRPGKPVNITPFCKLSPTIVNCIETSWTSNYNHSYAFVLTIVKTVSSHTLLQRLKNRGFGDSEHTKAMIANQLRQDEDAGIATTSLQASLICPLGKIKMHLPCRATTCSHIACFDANLYIQLNEKKPKWRCPVCEKPALFRDLIIDGLFMDIVSRVTGDCTDVQLYEDGTWTTAVPAKKPKEVVKKLNVEQTKKKPSKKVECVDLGSDSDTEDTWKYNQTSQHPQSPESPPVIFIPPEPNILAHCPTPPMSVFSPSSSMYDTDFGMSPQVVEPVPVCLTSNVHSDLASSEHLNILPDINTQIESCQLPSTSNSGPDSLTFPPYLTSSTSTFGAGSTNTFSETLSSEDPMTTNSDSMKHFDFYSLLQPPSPCEQGKYKEFGESESNSVVNELNLIPDVIEIPDD